MIAYLPNGNPITLETIIYGLAALVMLITVTDHLFWHNRPKRPAVLLYRNSDCFSNHDSVLPCDHRRAVRYHCRGPQFKPVIALVIIAGVSFGGEAGFLVGAMSMLVSNVFFGQGPWTPWQMVAAGIIGFLAGILFRKGILGRTQLSLCIFDGLATLAIYGVIMDSSFVFMFAHIPTRAMFTAAFLQGIPFNIIHGVATVFFLAVISQPMLEKLDRIKVKYGLVEPVIENHRAVL